MVINWVKKNKINLAILTFTIIVFISFIEFINFSYINHDQLSVWPPNLKQTFYPNKTILNGITGLSHFSINGLGYRSPLIKDKNDEFRILVIGGSTTECLYLDDMETWPYLIMEKLPNALDNKRPITMNIGKSGHNTRDHILQLKHLSDSYEPDLVIMMLGFNDALLKLSKRWVWKPFDEDSYDQSKTFSSTNEYNLKSTFIYNSLSTINKKYLNNIEPQDTLGNTLQKQRENRLFSTSYIHNKPDFTEALIDYENNINTIIKISRDKNIPIILITQPYLYKEQMTDEENSALWMTTDFNGNYYQTEFMISTLEKYNSKLLSICQAKNTSCYDIEKTIPKSLNFFYDDVHFNENGADLVANLISNYIINNVPEFNNQKMSILL